MRPDPVQNERQLLPVLVAERIKKMIIDQGMPVGANLPNEFELAQMLGVGRGTVREAVKLLSSKSIVQVRRGSGTFVSSISDALDDPWSISPSGDRFRLAFEILELRTIVEPPLCRLAAERATDEEIQELLIQKEHCDRATLASSILQEDEDAAFHIQIIRCSHNATALKLAPVIATSISTTMKSTQFHLDRETQASHDGIMNAIIRRDGAEAESHMREHLDTVSKWLHAMT